MRALVVSGACALTAWLAGRYTGVRAGYRLGHDRVVAWRYEHGGGMPRGWTPDDTGIERWVW